MVDWESPPVIAQDLLISVKLNHVVLGLYTWEWFISLDFDWQYISGKKKFRWPLIFYFLNRYSLFLMLIGLTISVTVTHPINCQALYTFNQFMGSVAVGMVSINLSLRTMAVWGHRWYIVTLLILITLGHWSIILHGVQLKAEWDTQAAACIITETKPTIIAAEFIYSMCFDFVVMCLTAFRHYTSHVGRSSISTLIFTDGLVYFIIAFLANMGCSILILLPLNPILRVIGTVPAGAASTIVGCRVVRRLANYNPQGGVPQPLSSVSFSWNKNAQPISPTSTGGVHVQMQTLKEVDVSEPQATLPVEYKSHNVI